MSTPQDDPQGSPQNSPPAGPQTGLKLLQVPASRGLAWVREGVRLFMRQPAALSVLLLASLFIITLAGSLPLLGGALVMSLAPWMNLSFLLAGEEALAGRPVSPRVFGAPFAAPPARRRRIVQLCVLHGLAAVGLLALADLIDADYAQHLESFLTTYGKPDTPIDLEGLAQVQRGALFRLAILLPLIGLAWYAPIILLRHEASLAKALFASALTLWRNTAAFALYGLGWMAVNVVVGLVGFTIVLLLGQPAYFPAVLFPLSTMFAAAVLVSQVYTVRDCLDMAAPGPAGPTDPGAGGPADPGTEGPSDTRGT